jgi:hypothetical protein
VRDDYRTSTTDLETDPSTWQVPARTGCSVVSPWDADGPPVILLYVESRAHRSDVGRSVIYALDEVMACGIITSLLAAMREADVPINRLDALVAKATATLRKGRDQA